MIRLAKQTLKVIEEAIDSDGGTLFRSLSEKYLPLMDDAYRPSGEAFRKHLGVSMIGKSCSRELWYNFRWATKSFFPARIQRLFNRGHLEEARFLAMLEMIGTQVWCGPEEGGQYRVEGYRGHFGSALDGICLGLPDEPTLPCLGEFKTSNDKGFKALNSKGVKEAKWVHYVQMQVCMAAYRLPIALYLVVNKNDDDLYGEIVEQDLGIAQKYNERAALIIDAKEPPMKINKSPSWFECKFCAYNRVCHYNESAERTCRSCAHSTPRDNGCWSCPVHTADIPFEVQLCGCEVYEYNDKFNFPV